MKYRIDEYNLKGDLVKEGGIIYNSIEGAKEAFLRLNRISAASNGSLFRIKCINECDFCSGDIETQQPLPNDDIQSVWTLDADKKMIGIVTCEPSPRVFTCHFNFCPMCGRKLKED